MPIPIPTELTIDWTSGNAARALINDSMLFGVAGGLNFGQTARIALTIAGEISGRTSVQVQPATTTQIVSASGTDSLDYLNRLRPVPADNFVIGQTDGDKDVPKQYVRGRLLPASVTGYADGVLGMPYPVTINWTGTRVSDSATDSDTERAQWYGANLPMRGQFLEADGANFRYAPYLFANDSYFVWLLITNDPRIEFADTDTIGTWSTPAGSQLQGIIFGGNPPQFTQTFDRTTSNVSADRQGGTASNNLSINLSQTDYGKINLTSVNNRVNHVGTAHWGIVGYSKPNSVNIATLAEKIILRGANFYVQFGPRATYPGGVVVVDQLQSVLPTIRLERETQVMAFDAIIFRSQVWFEDADKFDINIAAGTPNEDSNRIGLFTITTEPNGDHFIEATFKERNDDLFEHIVNFTITATNRFGTTTANFRVIHQREPIKFSLDASVYTIPSAGGTTNMDLTIIKHDGTVRVQVGDSDYMLNTAPSAHTLNERISIGSEGPPFDHFLRIDSGDSKNTKYRFELTLGDHESQTNVDYPIIISQTGNSNRATATLTQLALEAPVIEFATETQEFDWNVVMGRIPFTIEHSRINTFRATTGSGDLIEGTPEVVILGGGNYELDVQFGEENIESSANRQVVTGSVTNAIGTGSDTIQLIHKGVEAPVFQIVPDTYTAEATDTFALFPIRWAFLLESQLSYAHTGSIIKTDGEVTGTIQTQLRFDINKNPDASSRTETLTVTGTNNFGGGTSERDSVIITQNALANDQPLFEFVNDILGINHEAGLYEIGYQIRNADIANVVFSVPNSGDRIVALNPQGSGIDVRITKDSETAGRLNFNVVANETEQPKEQTVTASITVGSKSDSDVLEIKQARAECEIRPTLGKFIDDLNRALPATAFTDGSIPIVTEMVQEGSLEVVSTESEFLVGDEVIATDGWKILDRNFSNNTFEVISRVDNLGIQNETITSTDADNHTLTFGLGNNTSNAVKRSKINLRGLVFGQAGCENTITFYQQAGHNRKGFIVDLSSEVREGEQIYLTPVERDEIDITSYVLGEGNFPQSNYAVLIERKSTQERAELPSETPLLNVPGFGDLRISGAEILPDFYSVRGESSTFIGYTIGVGFTAKPITATRRASFLFPLLFDFDNNLDTRNIETVFVKTDIVEKAVSSYIDFPTKNFVVGNDAQIIRIPFTVTGDNIFEIRVPRLNLPTWITFGTTESNAVIVNLTQNTGTGSRNISFNLDVRVNSVRVGGVFINISQGIFSLTVPTTRFQFNPSGQQRTIPYTLRGYSSDEIQITNISDDTWLTAGTPANTGVSITASGLGILDGRIATFNITTNSRRGLPMRSSEITAYQIKQGELLYVPVTTFNNNRLAGTRNITYVLHEGAVAIQIRNLVSVFGPRDISWITSDVSLEGTLVITYTANNVNANRGVTFDIVPLVDSRGRLVPFISRAVRIIFTQSGLL